LVSNRFVEQSTAEFFVGNTSTAIGVIKGEEGIEVLLSWDLNTNFLDSFSELIWFNLAIVVQIEIFEGF
jgi:hypothetical protein